MSLGGDWLWSLLLLGDVVDANCQSLVVEKMTVVIIEAKRMVQQQEGKGSERRSPHTAVMVMREREVS